MTNKWYGKIGFGITKEIRKGVWRSEVEKKSYYGDINNFRQNLNTQSNSTNEDVTINATISIIMDDFISNNCSSIRYVEFMGALWRVKEITPARPRLLLTLGGIYNGESDDN